MYMCYLDESGTAELAGSGTQFVYAGIAIPANTWKAKDVQIQNIKLRYALQEDEIHTAWIARQYPEQNRIINFVNLNHDDRRIEVLKQRTLNVNKRIAQGATDDKLKTMRKNYKKTFPYVHLTFDERNNFLIEVAQCIESWLDARVFFHAIDKTACNPALLPEASIYETAFQELMSRFQFFLTNRGRHDGTSYLGLVVSDNNQSMEKKLRQLSRRIHQRGTRWVSIPNIVETPLFVNSETTNMVQVADVVAYSIRRLIEKDETDLFRPIFARVDRAGTGIVGGRHYTWSSPCSCLICQSVRI